MARPAIATHLTASERRGLERLARESKTQRSYAGPLAWPCGRRWEQTTFGSLRLIRDKLPSASGECGLNTMVWRALRVDFRGRPSEYTNDELRLRLLAKLDAYPYSGYAKWNGRLLARPLGVSADQVWALLPILGINLHRRHSWWISRDPEFPSKSSSG